MSSNAENAEGLMSYIKHVLQPGETVRYQGSTHWMLYLPAILLLGAAVVILIVSWSAAQPYGILLSSLRVCSSISKLPLAPARCRPN